MRICLDANTVLRGIASATGPQSEILKELLTSTSELVGVASRSIVEEWLANAAKDSVQRYFNRRGVETSLYMRTVLDIVDRTELFEPTGEAPPCRDPDDRKYLHVAAQAQIQYLVTSDNDLLDVGTMGACRILTAQSFMAVRRKE